MYNMQDLPTNKANFLFKNMQDFNQTMHVGPQDPNVFTDNISFYFYAIMAISTQSKNFPSFEVEYPLQNAKCVFFNTVLFNLDCIMV